MIDPNHDGEIIPEESGNFIDKIFEMFTCQREEMKLYFQFSFQPDVSNVLEHEYLLKILGQQRFIINHFAEKLAIANKQNAYFPFWEIDPKINHNKKNKQFT
jgi:hypothetical protein